MSKDHFRHLQNVYAVQNGSTFSTQAVHQNHLDSTLSGIISSMDIGVWQLDMEYRVVGHNEKAARIYGNNIIGNYCYRLADQKNRVCPQCSAKRVYGGSTGARSGHQSIDAAGNRIFTDHIAAPIRNAKGSLTGVMVFIFDMKSHKRINNDRIRNIETLEKIVQEKTRDLEKIKAECFNLYNQSNARQALYRSLLDASAEAVVIYDLMGHVKYLNPRFTEIFGWRRQDLVDHKIPFIPPKQSDQTHEQWRKAIEGGAPVERFKTQRLTKDNRILDVEVRVARYNDHQYRPAGMLVTFNRYKPTALKIRNSDLSEAPDGVAAKETILLVDDEKMVRDVGRPMLEKIGYSVLVASGGREAIDLYEKHAGKIQLVIIDFIMPEMNGGQLYEALKHRDPDVKALLSSGYSVTGDAEEILAKGCNGFIQKPFGIEALSRKIRMILND